MLKSLEHLHPAFNSVDIKLSQRGKGAKGKDGEDFRLNIVNTIYLSIIMTAFRMDKSLVTGREQLPR